MDGNTALATLNFKTLMVNVSYSNQTTANSQLLMAGSTSTSWRRRDPTTRWLSRQAILTQDCRADQISNASDIRESKITRTKQSNVFGILLFVSSLVVDLLTCAFRYDDKYLHKIIADDFIDMDDPEVPQRVKDNIEFVLDVSDINAHILHVELKKNQTRADEAKLLRQQVLDSDRQTGNTDRIDKDVLVFYIDNISRPNFHRKLKKLSKWLDEFADGAEAEQVEVSLNLIFCRMMKISGTRRRTMWRMSTSNTIHWLTLL